jgi:hypothetical protein
LSITAFNEAFLQMSLHAVSDTIWPIDGAGNDKTTINVAATRATAFAI